MRKRHKLGRSGGTDGCMTCMHGTCQIEMPKARFWGALPNEDGRILVRDGDIGGGEPNIATSVAELSNRNEWLRRQIWNNVPLSCGARQ